ncbi:MAG: sulfur carrier protein ThiS [Solirubrobacterales bacterium]|nr:sulfur carrier protein ThiS [Solirubrobacterales bacterium]
MTVEVNGKRMELRDGASVRDAALAIGVEPGRGVAIALEGEVIPRGRLAETMLSEGQRVEVVTAIGGGCR